MTVRPCAVLLLALLATGCAGLGLDGGDAPDGRRAVAVPDGDAIARGRMLAGVERNHPGLLLSEAAARAAERAGREALAAPVGGRTDWRDPASGAQGSFIALRDYTSAAGSHCREILPRVIAPSGTFTGSTVACRRIDGRWYVLD
ncbi:MAG TPA: hypothetical protein VFG47_18420 [Geminicoccaceae bacterium]|nr:hypothetical protein [Geminicoccaceae bacterium]